MYEPLTPNTQTQLVDLYFSKMCDQTIILVNSFESKKKKKIALATNYVSVWSKASSGRSFKL